MQKESIEEALDVCIDGIYNSKKLNIVEKVEFMINIRHFLENYDEMIKVKVKKYDRSNSSNIR